MTMPNVPEELQPPPKYRFLILPPELRDLIYMHIFDLIAADLVTKISYYYKDMYYDVPRLLYISLPAYIFWDK